MMRLCDWWVSLGCQLVTWNNSKVIDMNTKQFSLAWLMGLTFLSSQLLAHKAPAVEDYKLVPIPQYSQKYGAASAKGALQAAKVLISTLSKEQRAQASFKLKAKQRSGWSNLPAGIVEREGISVGELTVDQREHLFDFLSASLSPAGYQSVMNVMAAEAFLSGDKRAARLKWAPENYWISFYGTVEENQAWGWQFGGHHLALNIAIENNEVESMSPSFIGTEPALFSYNGVEYRSVVDMHETGYALYKGLSKGQQKAANAVSIPDDILTGPGKDGFIPEQLGVSAIDFDEKQRQLLIAAIEQWVLVQPNENALREMETIKKELSQTSFVWCGTTEINTPSYMRIQGPSVIIELLSTGGNVGDSAQGQGHYHTIYRNPNNEYGLD